MNAIHFQKYLRWLWHKPKHFKNITQCSKQMACRNENKEVAKKYVYTRDVIDRNINRNWTHSTMPKWHGSRPMVLRLSSNFLIDKRVRSLWKEEKSYRLIRSRSTTTVLQPIKLATTACIRDLDKLNLIWQLLPFVSGI